MQHSKQHILFVLILVAAVSGVLVALQPVAAQSGTASSEIKLQVHLPGTSLCTDPANAGSYCVKDFGEYLMNFYRWFVSITGVLAIAMVVLGGFRWITAAGNSSKIEEAKDIINGAFSGIVLIMISFLFLQLINPQILTLRLPVGDIEKVDFKIGTAFCGGRDIEETNLSCGDTATLKTTSSGKKQTCIYEGNCTSTGQLCSLKKRDDDVSWACQSLSEACLNTGESDCNWIDSQLAGSSDPNIKAYSCIKADIRGRGDRCQHGRVLPVLYEWDGTPDDITQTEYKCPKMPNGNGNNDSARVSCSFAGTAKSGVLDTDCWDVDDGPKVPTQLGIATVTVVGARPRCSDSARANEMVNSACCAVYLKKEIDCQSDRRGSDVEVDCAYYDVQPGKYASGGYDSAGDGNEICETKCWMEIYLYHPGTNQRVST